MGFLLAMLVMALVGTIGVASIMPFMSLMANPAPAMVTENP